MTNLEKQVIYHDKLYRIGKPEISDQQFDSLYEQLPEESFIKRKGGVIFKVEGERMETLPIPMYSMDKLKTIKELRDWLISLNLPKDAVIVITGKYDGISLCAAESIGEAWTRGDGNIGQQSKDHFTMINSGPYAVEYDGAPHTFGEAIMPNALFQKHKKSPENPDGYANPRNMVGGLLNTSEIRKDLTDVYYMRYGTSVDTMHKKDMLEALNQYNPAEVYFDTMSVENLTRTTDEEQLIKYFDAIYKHVSNTFLIDGLIIEVNDATYRKSLGRERNNNPAYARALKLDIWQSGDILPVEDYSLSISKQGELKGTVTIPTTNIGGVDVTNATFYNARFLMDWGLTVGRPIKVIRSGDVIPKIVEVDGIKVPLKENFKTPKEWKVAYDKAAKKAVTMVYGTHEYDKLRQRVSHCPSCGTPLAWDDTEVELVCNSSNCPSKSVKKIAYFFEKAGFEDFGEARVKDLWKNRYTSVEEILNIKREDLVTLEGWGESSADKLLKQIDALTRNGMSMAEQMQAFDVFEGRIGSKTAQIIIDAIMLDGVESNVVEIAKIHGVGEKFANAYAEGMGIYRDNFMGLVRISYAATPVKEQTGTSFEGWAVCFSGCRNKDLQERIESEGGKIVSGVSKNTTHLIVKDLSEKVLSSSKSVKAKGLGIEIIQIGDLL